MSRRRTAPRLHIRGLSDDVIDTLEIMARSESMDLYAWLRKTLNQLAVDSTAKRRIEAERIKSDLEVRAILYDIAGDEIVDRAKARAAAYLTKAGYRE